MANYFTRHHNDKESSILFDKSNKDLNMIVMDKSVQENSSFCYASSGSINSQSQIARPIKEGMLDLGTKADIESKLMNRHKELNSSERTNKDYAAVPVNDPGQCSLVENLMNEDSRYTNPVVNYREMNTISYAFNPYLPIDLQQVVLDNKMFLPPTRGGNSSRIDAKSGQYGLLPKEFATISPQVDFIAAAANYLPVKQKATPAYAVVN